MAEDNQSTNSPTQPTVLYEWTALEFNRSNKRPVTWYWAVGGVWVLLAGYTVWMQQWIRLAVLLLLAVLIWLVSRMKPKEFRHTLTNSAIIVGGREYVYNQFSSFGVVNSQEGFKVIVSPNRALGPGLTLQVGGGDVERIRAILSQYLPEEEKTEDIVDKANRWFKF